MPMLYPVRAMGYSKQRLYWDNEAGTLPFYDEVFTIQMELNTGAIIEYRGSAKAEITALQRMDKEKIAGNLDKHIRDLGIAKPIPRTFCWKKKKSLKKSARCCANIPTTSC